MTQIEINDPYVTKLTLIQAQSALKRQFGDSAQIHISRLQRMIDQLDLHDFLEHSHKSEHHISGRREHGATTEGGVWALGRYWSKDQRRESENGPD